VGETEDVDTDRSVQLGTGPEGDTDAVERSEVGTEWGPLEVQLSPLAILERLALDSDRLRVAVPSVPVDVDVRVTESEELVASLGIAKPASKVVLACQRGFLLKCSLPS
jgi:hypothetical protein